MRKILQSGSDSQSQTAQAPPSDEPSFPPGLWDALQRPSRNRPAPRSFATFNSILDVCSPNSDGTGNISNKFDLLCPREECGSVILKPALRNGSSTPVYRWNLKACLHIASFPLSHHHQTQPNGGSSFPPRWHSRTSASHDPYNISNPQERSSSSSHVLNAILGHWGGVRKVVRSFGSLVRVLGIGSDGVLTFKLTMPNHPPRHHQNCYVIQN